MGPAHGPRAHELEAYGVSSICVSFKPRNVPATFFSAIFLDFTFFQSPEKEPQRPYDQNGGSIAPRSLIFDPFAKETVSPKNINLGVTQEKSKGPRMELPKDKST